MSRGVRDVSYWFLRSLEKIFSGRSRSWEVLSLFNTKYYEIIKQGTCNKGSVKLFSCIVSYEKPRTATGINK